jgi:hypothetical protein
VFIVEPLYWIAAAPMFFVLRTIWARVVLGLALLIALTATVVTYSARPTWYLVIIILTGLFLFMSKRASARTAAWTSAVTAVGVTSMFIVAGLAAAHRAQAIDAQAFPSEQRVDHVLTPRFASPFCWDVLMVQTGGGQYTVRVATLTNSQALMPVDQCYGRFLAPAGTAPLSPVPAHSSAAIQWYGQFSMPEGRLARLAAQDCEAREALQFARAPFATRLDGHWVLGDLRFDREKALGFTEIALQGKSRCRYSVPWVPPREALLEAPEGVPGSNLGGSAGY